MSRLTRDGTGEPVSRYRTLRHERNAEREIFIFPVQLTTSRIGNHTRLIHTLAIYSIVLYCIVLYCMHDDTMIIIRIFCCLDLPPPVASLLMNERV